MRFALFFAGAGSVMLMVFDFSRLGRVSRRRNRSAKADRIRQRDRENSGKNRFHQQPYFSLSGHLRQVGRFRQAGHAQNRILELDFGLSRVFSLELC